MKNTNDKHLHVVAFATPYPPRYGGVIDVFYKIKALAEQGIHIHLHAFTYDGHPPAEALQSFCDSIHYYERNTHWKTMLSLKPYIIKSRQNKKLLQNLLKDDYPILFEGLHTTGFINHAGLSDRVKIVREANIEHHYYYNLFKSAQSLKDKLFFLIEAAKLALYQPRLKKASRIAAISMKDREYLQKHFPHKKVILLPPFHSSEQVNAQPGTGKYVLYHGNMSVAENYRSAEYLIREVFSHIKTPFIIAGLNPPQHLKSLVSKYNHIRLIENPDDEKMKKLISGAQIHVLITFQATGLKLKLLNTLYNGRHVIVNSKMTEGTMIEPLCENADTGEELRQKISDYMEIPFKKHHLERRKTFLENHYSNTENARQFIKVIFS